MFGAGAFAWSEVVVVCVAFGFICFVLFLFLFLSFFFFSLGIKGGLKLFLAVVQWVGSFGGLSRRLCPNNLTDSNPTQYQRTVVCFFFHFIPFLFT